MKTVRTISKILFNISVILCAGYLASFLLSVAALSTGWSLYLVDNDRRFVICYPFTNTPYLLGEYNGGYILMFLLLLGLYALFFYLVGRVFTAFAKPKLFTAYGIRQLRLFYLGNLVLPTASAIIISIFYNIESPAGILITLHMLLGVFTYFMAAIFKEGYHLQTENDLIL